MIFISTEKTDPVRKKKQLRTQPQNTFNTFYEPINVTQHRKTSAQSTTATRCLPTTDVLTSFKTLKQKIDLIAVEDVSPTPTSGRLHIIAQRQPLGMVILNSVESIQDNYPFK